jgi:hypothetical protein
MQLIATFFAGMVLGGFIVDLITSWINQKEKLEMKNEYKFRSMALHFEISELLDELKQFEKTGVRKKIKLQEYPRNKK